MRVVDESCHVCRVRGVCWWITAPTLRLCADCYFDHFGIGPPA